MKKKNKNCHLCQKQTKIGKIKCNNVLKKCKNLQYITFLPVTTNAIGARLTLLPTVARILIITIMKTDVTLHLFYDWQCNRLSAKKKNVSQENCLCEPSCHKYIKACRHINTVYNNDVTPHFISFLFALITIYGYSRCILLVAVLLIKKYNFFVSILNNNQTLLCCHKIESDVMDFVCN